MEFSLAHEDQLDPLYADEFTNIMAALQVAFSRTVDSNLLVSLKYRDEIGAKDPTLQDELDNLLAQFQSAFNSKVFSTFVKGYTEYEITFAAAESTHAKTLASAVVVENTELVYLGLITPEPAPYAAGTAYVTLTNTNTVTASRRGDLATTTLTIRFGVLEYQPGVLRQAVQYGTIVNAAVAGTDAVITEVGPRAKVCFLGYLTDYVGTSNPSRIQPKLSLRTTRAVTAYRDTAGADGHVVSFCVVDFK